MVLMTLRFNCYRRSPFFHGRNIINEVSFLHVLAITDEVSFFHVLANTDEVSIYHVKTVAFIITVALGLHMDLFVRSLTEEVRKIPGDTYMGPNCRK